MKAAPAIPLFGDAYLADTRHLSLEEHGAYLQLLMIAWRSEGCRLPDDDTRLARILGVPAAKWRKLKPVVMAFWDLDDGHWSQRRLSKERNFVEEKRAKNTAAAETRWKGQAPENIEGDVCERISERNAPPPPPPQEEVSDASHHLSASPTPLPVSAAFDGWNENAAAAGWPTIRKLSAGRTAALRARLRDEGMEGWRAALIRARSSPFLGQSPPPPWFTFDWITKQANFLKLTEGNYDRDRQSHPRPAELRGSRPSPAMELLRQAEADEHAEFAAQAGDCGTWPALPAIGGG